MMIWIVAYVALLAYAAILLVYCARHDRPQAAIGILLSIAGFQFALSAPAVPVIGLAIAISGLGIVARDLVATLRPHVVPAPIRRSPNHTIP